MERNLFIDKYRPKSMAELDFGGDVNKFLSILAQSGTMPHLILEGCRGSGKRLRLMLFLQEKFNPKSTFAVKNVTMNLEIPGKTELIPIHAVISPYHYQLNPSTHSVYDRSLVQVFINEVVRYKVVSGISYRIIVIEDADLLSVEAQESLRRTLETHIGSCRFIFLSNREDKLIEPLYSRCVCVRFASPSDEVVANILGRIAKMEGRTVEEEVIKEIAHDAQRNLSTAHHLLNKYLLRTSVSKGVYRIVDYDSVQRICSDILDTIIKGSDMDETISSVRLQIYELVTYCVNLETIIPRLMAMAIARIPKDEYGSIHDVTLYASEYDTTIRSSSKPMYHIEAFCLRLFSVIKDLMGRRKQLTKKKTTVIKPIVKVRAAHTNG